MYLPSLPEQIFSQRSRSPQRICFTHVGSDGKAHGSWNLKDLWASAGGVANRLRELGIRSRERVVISLPVGVAVMPSVLGVWLAGGVPVMAPRGHRWWAAPGLGPVRFGLCEKADHLKWSVQRMLPGRPSVRWIAWNEADVADVAPPRPLADDPGLICLSPGTSHAPRWVVFSHGALAHQSRLQARELGIEESSRAVTFMNPDHYATLFGGYLNAMMGIGRVWAMEPEAIAARPWLWLQMASRVKATYTLAPEATFAVVAARTPLNVRQDLDLSSLRTVVCSGEPIRPTTVEEFFAAFGPCGLRASAFCASYSLIEHACGVTAWGETVQQFDLRAVQDGVLEPGRGVFDATLVGCGSPSEDLELAIADPESGGRLVEGQVGEIWLRSPSVALGYLGERFVLRELDGDPGWLATGDMGAVLDAELFVLGRLERSFYVQGRRVFAELVESTVGPVHPDIRPRGVVVFPTSGASGLGMGVAVELRQRDANPEQVLDAVSDAIAHAYGIRPAELHLLRPRSLPRSRDFRVRAMQVHEWSAAGKLGRLALRSVSQDGGPVPDAGRILEYLEATLRDVAYVRPEDRILRLDRAFRDALCFELGGGGAGCGDALSRVPLGQVRQAFGRVAQSLGARVSEEEIARAGSREDMAASLLRASGIGDGVARAGGVTGVGAVPGRVPENTRVTVLGTTPAALTAAWELYSAGVSDLVVLEPKERLRAGGSRWLEMRERLEYAGVPIRLGAQVKEIALGDGGVMLKVGSRWTDSDVLVSGLTASELARRLPQDDELVPYLLDASSLDLFQGARRLWLVGREMWGGSVEEACVQASEIVRDLWEPNTSPDIAPVRGARDEGPWELLPWQRDALAHSLENPGASSARVTAFGWVRGELSTRRAAEALSEVVRRSDDLRLCLRRNGTSWHLVLGMAPPAEVVDVSDAPNPPDAIAWAVRDRAVAPQGPIEGRPLVRLVLFRGASDLHGLALFAHAAVFDRHSLSPILDRILAAIDGRPATRSGSPQAEMVGKERRAQTGHALAWWSEHLTRLPGGDIAERSSKPASSERVRLPTELSRRVLRLMEEDGWSLQALHYGALSVVRAGFEPDGVPVIWGGISPRRPKDRELAGRFHRSLPLWMGIRGATALRQVFERTKAAVSGATQHRLVDLAEVEASLGQSLPVGWAADVVEAALHVQLGALRVDAERVWPGEQLEPVRCVLVHDTSSGALYLDWSGHTDAFPAHFRDAAIDLYCRTLDRFERRPSTSTRILLASVERVTGFSAQQSLG